MEDVRINKRDKVIQRAEELYKKMGTNGKSLSESIIQSVREEVEKKEILSYGEERLPAGPAVGTSDSIIVVEGRNDVLNLLRYGIKNTIAVQGTSVPKTVKELSKARTVTLFVDGDHGGELIIKEMLQVADVDFIARAPPGTEVEELTYKQIVKALKYKTPVNQYLESHGMLEELKEFTEKNNKAVTDVNVETKEELPQQKSVKEPKHVNDSEKESPVIQEINDINDPQFIKNKLNELFESKMVEIYDESGNPIARYPISDAVELMQGVKNASTIISGGVISQRFVDIAFNIGVKSIYGMKMGHVTKKPDEIRVVTWEHM